MNFLRFWRFLGARKRRDITLFPPWWTMNIRVVENRDNWRQVRLRLPLGFFTRNLAGHMFGGAQASIADPIAAMACAHVFPEYSTWARALTLDFRAPGDSDLELRFVFEPAQEQAIREELAARGRSTPTFEYGLYRADGTLCTHIKSVVAIRPKGYRGQNAAYRA